MAKKKKHGGKRIGAGRPMASGAPRDQKISVTLTADELRRLETWAAAKGLTLSRYIGSIASRLPDGDATAPACDRSGPFA